MEYIELLCRPGQDRPEIREILTAYLAGAGFQGFEELETEVRCYIPENAFQPEKISQIMHHLVGLIGPVQWKISTLAEKNWNEEWEKNFPPVVIEETCLIRAPFHKIRKKYPVEILLTPKMSFGTGHHPSTALMVAGMLKMNLSGKKVVDMGCGTGILSILAEKRGAKEVLAVDNNKWAVENALENMGINRCSRTELVSGDASLLEERGAFDLVLANINLNVIREDIPRYFRATRPGGQLLTSGFITGNSEEVRQAALQAGYLEAGGDEKAGWAALLFTRPESVLHT